MIYRDTSSHVLAGLRKDLVFALRMGYMHSLDRPYKHYRISHTYIHQPSLINESWLFRNHFFTFKNAVKWLLQKIKMVLHLPLYR